MEDSFDMFDLGVELQQHAKVMVISVCHGQTNPPGSGDVDSPQPMATKSQGILSKFGTTFTLTIRFPHLCCWMTAAYRALGELVPSVALFSSDPKRLRTRPFLGLC